MERIYTQQDIDRFFNEFKRLQNSFTLNMVHQLINNPYAKATHRVRFKSKLLKIIIMTSAFITGTSILFIWLTSQKTNIDNINHYQSEEQYTEIISDSGLKIKSVMSQNKTDENDLLENTISNKKNEDDISNSVNSKTKIGVRKINKKSEKSECNWPKDTLIDKNLLIVRLSDIELRKLGIYKKPGKFHYHNVLPEGKGYMEYTNYRKNDPDRNLKTHNDFFVLYKSDTLGEIFDHSGANLYNKIEVLVPVLFELIPDHYVIWWFIPSDSFYDSLPNRYKYIKEIMLNIECLKKKYPNRKFINYERSTVSILDKISALELSFPELENVGFEIYDDSLKISAVNDILSICFTKSSNGIKGNSNEVEYSRRPFPMTITDTIGRARYFTYIPNKKGEWINKEYLSDQMNFLIPIKINLKDIIETRDETLLFWFYPTDELIDALPEEIKTDLRAERDAIISGNIDQTKSCNYFEVCKSTLQLENFKLYPNPANYSITIEFDFFEEMNGSILVVNIAGVKLRELLPNTSFSSGHNSYDLNISGINPGVYLISINTDKGFKTQRLVISQ